MKLVKSKQRVADHGEVFTRAWMVVAVLAVSMKAGNGLLLISRLSEDSP